MTTVRNRPLRKKVEKLHRKSHLNRTALIDSEIKRELVLLDGPQVGVIDLLENELSTDEQTAHTKCNNEAIAVSNSDKQRSQRKRKEVSCYFIVCFLFVSNV